MNYKVDEVKAKPDNWPANAIECQLENIQTQVDKLKKDPSYKNKEILISLITNYDLNQMSMLGLVRTTEYEVACINSLFFDASILQLNALKVYLYEIIGNKTRIQKMICWFKKCNESIEIQAFEGLLPQLKLYYFSYKKFTVEKNKNYADQLIEIVKDVISYSEKCESEKEKQENICSITNSYISLINDISNFRCAKRTKIWAFNRNEIYKLYKLAAQLIKINGDSPTKRPLKGVLMMSISNYILKSRNNYNEDYICKYISQDVAKKSIVNHQVWMSQIERLNDEREQKVVPELFNNTIWKKYSWAQDINFNPTRKYYVSSFCKSICDEDMIRDYGECIYGYKDDRMAEILSPIILVNKKDGSKFPVFSQVISFDVLYDLEEAKIEINYLCKIIDCFDICDEEKKNFLEEILQYWILSVKDAKWSHERERRYVLFMYDDYEYNEVDLTDPNFLKLKTSLLIEPDFMLGKNPVKQYLRTNIDDKRKAISTRPYLFCYDCLNRDYDIAISSKKISKCTICGSKNISIENI